VVVRAGTVGPKDLLRAWILGLVAQAAGLPGAGVVIGEVKGVPVRRDLPPSRDPAGRLAQVLEFRSRIRARPVPLVPEVLAAWASAQEPEQRRELAWRAWNAGGTGRGPAQRPAARWLWGTDGDAFADLDDPLLEDLMALIVDPAWSAA
jgi:exonuclease V gamma subunit